jgi:phi LC3 family holin
MKINWKVRFKNKVWLTSFISLVVGFVFNLLTLFDVVPAVTQNNVMMVVENILTFLGLIGVLVDPTTAGLNDSIRAMGYEEPWQDPPDEE